MKKAWFNSFLLALVFASTAVGAGEEKKPIQIQLPDRSIVNAEVAQTPKERASGLMFRKGLAKDSGMLFVLDGEETTSFWMKNTFIDLDILFIDSGKIIREIFEKVPAQAVNMQDRDIATVTGRGKYVLELPAGSSGRHGLHPGDTLLFSLEQGK